MEASTPRMHGLEEWTVSSVCADSRPSAAEARSPAREWSAPDAAWARIRTPSPEPLAWSQSVPAGPAREAKTTEAKQECIQRDVAGTPLKPVVPRGQGPARPAREAMTVEAKQECVQPDIAGTPLGFKGVLSIGSVGHPYTCKEPCKYVRKNR